MTKRITITLTEDQAEHLVRILNSRERPKAFIERQSNMNGLQDKLIGANAFERRIRDALIAELVKL